MGRKIGKSAIEVMRDRFPANASEIETYADAFDLLAEKINSGGGTGGGATVVHITESSKDTYTADISGADLIALITAGESVVARYADDEIVVEMSLYEYNFDDKVDPYILFSSATASREDYEGFVTSKFAVYDVENDTWSYNDEAVAIPRLPDIKGVDSGKVMTVVNGAWDKANLPIKIFEGTVDSATGNVTIDTTLSSILNLMTNRIACYIFGHAEAGESTNTYAYLPIVNATSSAGTISLQAIMGNQMFLATGYPNDSVVFTEVS